MPLLYILFIFIYTDISVVCFTILQNKYNQFIDYHKFDIHRKNSMSQYRIIGNKDVICYSIFSIIVSLTEYRIIRIFFTYN